jgi:hypothetical protein
MAGIFPTLNLDMTVWIPTERFGRFKDFRYENVARVFA